jgi:hypothetical protein
MQRSILSWFAILILSATTIQANMAPMPWERSIDPSNLRSAPEAGSAMLTPIDSSTRADVAPIPSGLGAMSLVVAGIAASAGVVLLGLWLAKKGRSGDSPDE